MPSALRPSGIRVSGAERLLVVEDDPDSAEALAELLAQEGFEVRVAHSAQEALTIAPVFAPRISIIDVGLPMMDGHRLTSLLREVPALRDCRFIAVTGFGGDEVVALSVSAGCEAHLTKPLDFARLLEVLRRPASRAQG